MQEIQNTIYQVCRDISEYIRNGNNFHYASFSDHGKNQSDDDVKHLDIYANNLLKTRLSQCHEVRFIASEEDDNIIQTNNHSGKYLVSYDPLDGSQNIGVNITVGTIFAVFLLNEEGKIKNGHQIEMAGYCLYSQSFQMVVCQRGEPVYLYFNEYDREILQMPIKGKVYAINESNKYRWIDPKYQRLVDIFIREGKTQRWIGCLVADAHQILIKGGFFSYPRDEKNISGRLRLLYEAYPIAFLIEQAGGHSTNGYHESLLDLTFNNNNIHQKVPLILAGKYEMDLFKNM